MADVRALIVDDHVVVRDALRGLLARAGIDVVAEASNLSDAVAQARKAKPDVLILDAILPDSPGLTPLMTLSKSLPDTAIVYLGSDPDQHYAEQALHAGAARYVAKEDADTELAPLIAQLVGEDSRVARSPQGRATVHARRQGPVASPQ
ncbi:MAG TPA: response regulator transcription factor [Gaiellaceae bacterium]|nr:response regulator transcription factor [Gaiellaceae bacterium]